MNKSTGSCPKSYALYSNQALIHISTPRQEEGYPDLRGGLQQCKITTKANAGSNILALRRWCCGVSMLLRYSRFSSENWLDVN